MLNIPNGLSLIRILLVPGFVVTILYYSPEKDWLRFFALGIFLCAVITDGVDGFIARKTGKRTDLGALLDPLADKILLIAGFICLSVISNFPREYSFPPYVPVAIIAVDGIIILGWILLYMERGFLRPAPNWLGKAATVFQMASIICVLIHFAYSSYVWNTAVVLTVTSGMIYIIKGSRMLNESH